MVVKLLNSLQAVLKTIQIPPLNLIRNNHKFKENALQSGQVFYLDKGYNT